MRNIYIYLYTKRITQQKWMNFMMCAANVYLSPSKTSHFYRYIIHIFLSFYVQKWNICASFLPSYFPFHLPLGDRYSDWNANATRSSLCIAHHIRCMGERIFSRTSNIIALQFAWWKLASRLMCWAMAAVCWNISALMPPKNNGKGQTWYIYICQSI